MQLRRVRVISRWAREDWLKSKLRLSENNMQSTLERHASFHTRQRIVMPLFCFLRALGQALCIAPNNAHIELVQCLPVARCRLLALQNLQICRNCNARRILLDGEQRSALCVHGCSVTLQVLWKLLFDLGQQIIVAGPGTTRRTTSPYGHCIAITQSYAQKGTWMSRHRWLGSFLCGE